MCADNLIPLNNDHKPIRADAARNRKHLLDVAMRLFSEDGVEYVTMSAIARAAEVGKGTLYRHFEDKGALIHALLDKDMRSFQRDTLLYLRNSQQPRVALRWFLEVAVSWVIEHDDLLHEAAKQESLEMLQHPAHLWWRQTIYGLLSQLKLVGDLDYACDVLYVMLDVRTIRFQRSAQQYGTERIVAGLHMTLERLTPT